MKELIVTYEDVHRGCANLAAQIAADDWSPDILVAIASGGFIPARILKTFLKKPVYVVGLQRYDEDHALHPVPVKIQWIDEVEKKLGGKKILIVDEVDDTRVTLSYCLAELSFHGPEEMRVAVLHQKDKPKEASYPAGTKAYQAAVIPDVWIKYPWDALDIDTHNNLAR